MKFGESRRLVYLVILALLIARLCFVSKHEILAAYGDATNYGYQTIGAWELGFPPGYPVWLRLCNLAHLPQRIAIELLFAGSVLLLAQSLRCAFNLVSALAATLILTLSPFTLFLFDRGMSDGFFTCLTIFAVALTIDLLRLSRKSGWLSRALWFGFVLGLMAITRNEDPLLALWLFLLFVGIALLRWEGRLATLKQVALWKRPISVILASVATLLTVVACLCFSFYLTQGVFTRGIALVPGHQKLLLNLATIDTGEPVMKYIPITRKSRELAYKVSPTFARFRLSLEDPNYIWTKVSRDNGIPNNEIGGGWIWHAINYRILSEDPKHLSVGINIYKKINSELAQAFRDGKLKRKFIIHPYIGGDVAQLLRSLPGSIREVVVGAFMAETYAPDQDYMPEVFDSAFNRRANLIPALRSEPVIGWAFVEAPGLRITKTLVSSDVSQPAPASFVNRDDVANVFVKQRKFRPVVFGFELNLPYRNPDSLAIDYELQDGSHMRATHLRAGTLTLVHGHPGGSQILQAIDTIGYRIEGGQQSTAGLTYYAFLSRPWMNYALASLVVIALIASQIRQRTTKCRPLFLTFFIICTISWCARILLYSLINARAWPGYQIRYLAPAHAVWLILVAVSIGFLSLPWRVREQRVNQDLNLADDSSSNNSSLAQEMISRSIAN